MGEPRLTRKARRARRHAGLAVLVLVSGWGIVSILPGTGRDRFSLALAYIALGFLATTLVLGPLNLLSARPNPLSSDLRRDLGLWSAGLALAHTAVGLTVHYTGRMQHYFLAPPDRPSPIGVRVDAFGLANHAGLVAALLLGVLASISSDRALAWLGPRRWKMVQRMAYVAAGLTVGHGLLYQVLERRTLLLVAVLAAVSVGVAVLQGMGGRARRRSSPSASVSD